MTNQPLDVQVARVKRGVALLSVLSNSALVALKLIVGLAINSVSVIAEGIHSSLDLAAALIAFLAVKKASVPPDQEHAYGHGKIENVSGTIEAILIFVAAAMIIYESVEKLITGAKVASVDFGLLVMGISAAANTLVSRRLMKVARETESIALEADALHLSTDVLTSLGVFAGLILIRLTGLSILDPIVAIVVALIIIKAAWELTKTSFLDLMDRTLPLEEQELIMSILREHYPEVVTFHKVRTRRAGPERHIDMHVIVSPTTTVEAAHELSDHLEEHIESKLPNSHIVVHMEPCEEKCPVCSGEKCRGGGKVD